MRFSVSRLSAFAAVLLAASAGAPLSAAAADAAASITEFPLAAADAEPGGIVAGPGGLLWFAENGSDRFGRIATNGALAGEIAVVGGNLESELPAALAVGPDGAVWFTEIISNLIGRVTPAGVVTQFRLPTAHAGPVDIALGPDGNLWFTESMGNSIGRITPAGTIREFPLPNAGSGPLGIAAGEDGNLWFTEADGRRIGRITPAGVVAEFPLSASSSPAKIVAGPDGNLWFTDPTANAIGRITPAGAVSELPLPTAAATPLILALGPDGNLWFTEVNAGQLGRVTPAGEISEFALPTPGAGPAGITAGPDGNVWFTEIQGNRIGRVNLAAPSVCAPGPSTLCLDHLPGDGRFQATVGFRTAAPAGGFGSSGSGAAIPLGGLGLPAAGLFSFFDRANPEMMVKVLDGCAVNGHFWVFAAAATNVAFTLHVTDTGDGSVATYENPLGKAAAPVQDTEAFACGAGDEVAGGGAAAAAMADAVPDPPPAERGACATGGAQLCIGQRFAVGVRFTSAGQPAPATAVGLSALGVGQGGLFWFFNPGNPELLIKILDGCAVNGRYWVFYAAGTNVGFTVEVTDTRTGHHQTYVNVDGTAAPPVQDTSALPCG